MSLSIVTSGAALPMSPYNITIQHHQAALGMTLSIVTSGAALPMSPYNITIQHHQAALAMSPNITKLPWQCHRTSPRCLSNVTEHHQAALGMSLSIVTSGAALPISPYNITKLP